MFTKGDFWVFPYSPASQEHIFTAIPQGDWCSDLGPVEALPQQGHIILSAPFLQWPVWGPTPSFLYGDVWHAFPINSEKTHLEVYVGGRESLKLARICVSTLQLLACQSRQLGGAPT